ncbi:diguanylate cyclase [Oceanotoga sp. DSM 15011]|uniref:sensor domain-containing diguanylate cyclase n=1 Tax=Oceanotoga sp. DSM 15011 TaxID=2984951 RepID=UPI0021F4C6D8|nr:sensor domain-containing diguanylate cyclase [Oceanotoga sp. DSM 15011]UYP01170.1 diguanylate cyclase [Oceanotoga sp. DSM 15011]
MILSTLESLIDMGTWEYDLNSKNMKISKGSAKILGIENVSEFKREDFYKLVVSEDIQRAISYEQLFYKEAFIPTLTFKIITKYNDLKYLSSKVKVIKDNFGNNIKVLGVTLDITDMKLREKKLKLFEKAIEVAGYGIYITDVDGVIEYINPAFERITGFSKKDSIGEKTSILSSGMNGDDDYYKMWNTILSGNIWKEEIVNKKKNGDFYTAYQIITPIYNEKNKIEFFVAIQEDITEQKKNQELIRKYASYDSLTEAYNRRMGLIILEKQIKNYFKNKDNISICFLDINNLKYINDVYGHNFGDIMLKKFSETIMNSINEDDYFIRLGGDEFLIIFSKSDFKKANFIWDKIKEKFREINYEKKYPFKIEVAYGICEYNGEGLDDFISKADNLMYEKKRIMKNKE